MASPSLGSWRVCQRDARSDDWTCEPGNPSVVRTPWYTQTDFSFQQNYKISESKRLTFTANFQNLLNQRAVTAFNADITSLAVGNQYITLNSTDGSSNCAFGNQCYIGDGGLSTLRPSVLTVFRTS